jgi:hypothetical protein
MKPGDTAKLIGIPSNVRDDEMPIEAVLEQLQQDVRN